MTKLSKINQFLMYLRGKMVSQKPFIVFSLHFEQSSQRKTMKNLRNVLDFQLLLNAELPDLCRQQDDGNTVNSKVDEVWHLAHERLCHRAAKVTSFI